MKRTQQPLNWQYLIREAALILMLSYFFLLASTHNGLANYQVFSLTTIIFLAITLLWLGFGQRPARKKEIPLFIFLGALAVAAYASIDPRRSFTEVWLIGAALFLFLLTADLTSRGWESDLWGKALLSVGAIVMIFTWGEAIAWYRQWLETTGKVWPEIFYRLPTPNFLVVFLNILLMVACSSFLFARTKTAWVLSGLWILSAVGLIYLTSSRGGWLGTAAGLGAMTLLSAFAFPDKRKEFFKWLRQHRLFSILLLIGLLAFLLIFAWIFYQQSQLPTHAAIGESRSFLWQPAWQAFLGSPWIGRGPFTYFSFYVQQHSTPPSPLYLYSHSIYLDLLSGSGLLGLGTFLLMIGALVVGLFKKFSSTRGPEQAAAMAALAALAAFLVHGFVDSVHHTIPTAAWLLAIVLGVGIGKNENQRVQRVSLSVLLGLALAAGGGLKLWADQPLNAGVIAGNSGLWQEASQDFQQAVGRDPHLSSTYQQWGMSESKLAEQGSPAALTNAIAHFETALALDPYWGLNHANLGVLYRAQGDLTKATAALERAVALSPKSALFQLNLGVTYELLHDNESARRAYLQAITLQPLWAEAYFWRETPLRDTLSKDWADSVSRKPLTLTEAEQGVAARGDYLAPYLEVIPFYLAAQRWHDAQQAIYFAQLAYTGKEEERLLLQWYQAEFAAGQGDYALAAKLGDEAIHRFLWQGAYGPGTLGQIKYNQFVFRSPAMVMEVVPQMTMILLPDGWGDHLRQTAEWYQQSGEAERAEQLRQELKTFIPDSVDMSH